MSRSHSVALAFVLAGVASAQVPPPTPCAAIPGFHRLDFWVGSWTVWVGEQQVGVNRIRPILDGCALREEWQAGGGGRGVVARALFDGRFGPDAAALRVALEERGGHVVYIEIPEGHSRATWANRFDELLTRLWPSPK